MKKVICIEDAFRYRPFLDVSVAKPLLPYSTLFHALPTKSDPDIQKRIAETERRVRRPDYDGRAGSVHLGGVQRG